MKPSITEYSTAKVFTRYRIEAARNLRIEEYHGKILLDDLRSMASAVTSDPAWSADHHGLIDFSAASLALSANDVMRLGLILRREDYQSIGWLVFAAGTSSNFGTIRMLGRWAKNQERIRIFSSRPEAETWIERNGCSYPFRAPAPPAAGPCRISA